MDRGAWRAAVHGVGRVGHDLATKSLPPPSNYKINHRTSCDGGPVVENLPANAGDPWSKCLGEGFHMPQDH